VIQIAKSLQVAAVYRAGVTVYELAQRVFIEHFLYLG
jgi:hypothetical protein